MQQTNRSKTVFCSLSRICSSCQRLTKTPSTAGIIMVGVIVGSKKTGVNPDNVATPIAASFGDLITLAILAWISQGLYKCLGGFTEEPLLSLLCISLFAGRVVCLWCETWYISSYVGLSEKCKEQNEMQHFVHRVVVERENEVIFIRNGREANASGVFFFGLFFVMKDTTGQSFIYTYIYISVTLHRIPLQTI